MQPISGPGLGLPLPQGTSPVIPSNATYTPPTNKFSLAAGQVSVIPRGTWIVGVTGTISALQYMNPVSLQWENIAGPGAAWAQMVLSDGFNFRIANLSTAAYAASVTAAGSGYVSASTIVTPSAGNSTWLPIIGGALGTFTVVSGGANYSVAPEVFIPPPAAPGVAATATAALTSGAVSSVTIRTAGAGYTVAPPVYIIPSPNDPALGTITAANVTVALTGAGTLTAVLLQNFGTPQSSAPTLTVSGAGSSATAQTTPVSGSWVAAANDVVTMQPTG